MPKPKPKKKITKPATSKPKDPRVEEVYEKEVEFLCPVRGKVKQKVKITKYKTQVSGDPKHVLRGNDSIDKLEENDDGLSIYSEGEELGLEGGTDKDGDDA